MTSPAAGPAPNGFETDYLVVGAGATGMAFVDSVIADPDVDVIMIDRRHAAGGHWLDAYPFVRLHQPSAMYGVNSADLGHDRIEPDGADRGFYERASGKEICGYYDEVMQHQLLASGHVRFFPMCDYLGDRRFRSRLTGRSSDVAVRRRVVDATYLASRVPATDPPPFEVADGSRCIPVGELAGLAERPAGYVIVGGGKTALDACCWLLDQGTSPDDITWIRPRDAWILNRAFYQPRDSAVSTFEGVVIQLEVVASSESVDEIYERLEDVGVVLRTDRSVRPTMMKGGTISLGECEQLRRVENVVRLGYVQRIERDRIVLDEGSIETSPDHVHVHCASFGLGQNPPRSIFTEDTITLQCVTRASITLSAALIGFVEASGRTTAEKNRLCPPNAVMDTPFDFLRFLLTGMSTELEWRDAPDLQEWMEHSRLNLLSGLADHAHDEKVRELQGRFLAAIVPALAKLHELGARATPAERRLMFEPEPSTA
ncbi:MAG: hypothetical protein ACRDWD_02715 [Acidimicrobiia bacterium]